MYDYLYLEATVLLFALNLKKNTFSFEKLYKYYYI